MPLRSELARYHFEIRTAGSSRHPGATFTPAYYAETLEDAEAQARRSYPSALRVILVDVERSPLAGLEEPLAWETLERYNERTGRELDGSTWFELVATRVATTRHGLAMLVEGGRWHDWTSRHGSAA